MLPITCRRLVRPSGRQNLFPSISSFPLSEVKMHIVVMNAIFIRLVTSVGLGPYGNVAQLMELPLIYFVTAEFYDLFVVAELGEL